MKRSEPVDEDTEHHTVSQTSPMLASPIPHTGPSTKKIKLDTTKERDDVVGEEQGEEWEQSATRRKKSKKVKKLKNKEFIESLPLFSFDGNELRSRTLPIGIEELRNLIVGIVLSNPIPRWLVVKNPKNIKRFVVLHIPGITPELLGIQPPPPTTPVAYPAALPNTSTTLSSFHKLFSHACPTRAPGEPTKLHSVLTTMLTIPISLEEKTRRAKERDAQQAALSRINDPGIFMLTPQEMLTHGYRVPSYVQVAPPADEGTEDANGWVRLPPSPLASPWVESPQVPTGFTLQKIWAVDCEMIETTAGRELARISIVDFQSGLVVFDSLVQPSNPVTSYLTQFSGLTAEILSRATRSLSDIQATLLAPGMVDSNTILLGHSLENDLAALKLAHPKVIDTALIYHHTKGPPSKPGLKWLASRWLSKAIQVGEGGHDSREDALTCVELLRKKMQFGVTYGQFNNDMESIFDAMTRSQKTSIFIGPGASQLGSKATSRVECTSDNEVMNGLIENIDAHNFVFARLQQVSHSLGWSTPYQPRERSDPHLAATSAVDNPPAPPPPLPLPEALAGLNAQLAQLHQSLPAYTALCIFTGHSDPRNMSALNKRKTTWDGLTRGIAQGGQGRSPADIPKEEWWTAADGRALETEAELAKRGLAFFCITLPKIAS